MANNNLENFSLYLWNNPEGYHVTVTTNYNTPKQKRSFFSFGKQTYKSWRAYNDSQPGQLKEFFANFKNEFQPKLKGNVGNYWISKLAVNTGNKGRRVAKGIMILVEEHGKYHFIVQLGDHHFDGEFESSLLTDKQRKGAKGVCEGAFIWKEDDDDCQEYEEAY